MTSRDFCFWLQGYFELTEAKWLCADQVKTIERHLALVFTHEIDSSMGTSSQQAALNQLHELPNIQTEHGPIKYPPLARC